MPLTNRGYGKSGDTYVGTLSAEDPFAWRCALFLGRHENITIIGRHFGGCLDPDPRGSRPKSCVVIRHNIGLGSLERSQEKRRIECQLSPTDNFILLLDSEMPTLRIPRILSVEGGVLERVTCFGGSFNCRKHLSFIVVGEVRSNNSRWMMYFLCDCNVLRNRELLHSCSINAWMREERSSPEEV